MKNRLLSSQPYIKAMFLGDTHEKILGRNLFAGNAVIHCWYYFLWPFWSCFG
ncbi:hypothetical protein CCP3SC5AM1_320012 [Gammaproteobacteria bacterium]